MAEVKKYGTVIITASSVSVANQRVTEMEALGFDVIGAPSDFNGKILIAMKKTNPAAMSDMMNSMMGSLNK